MMGGGNYYQTLLANKRVVNDCAALSEVKRTTEVNRLHNGLAQKIGQYM